MSSAAGTAKGAGRRLRVGVIGTGVIAQVMHLHYLAELADLFEVAAVCDISAQNARACAERYRIPPACADWRHLIASCSATGPLDAVLVLTSGSGAPIAIAAAQAGLYVFTEKPMCFSAAEVAAGLAADADAAVTAAIGPEQGLRRYVYREVLLDTLVHEINAVRGVLGDPDWLDYADLSEQSVTVLLRYGALRVAIHWVDLPGLVRYQMEFAIYAPDRRVTLTFPPPYLRNESSSLVTEGGESGSVRSWRNEEIIGYESGFRRELEAFHASSTGGSPPPTADRDGLADVAVCQAIIQCHRTGRPVRRPAEFRPEPARPARVPPS